MRDDTLALRYEKLRIRVILSVALTRMMIRDIDNDGEKMTG